MSVYVSVCVCARVCVFNYVSVYVCVLSCVCVCLCEAGVDMRKRVSWFDQAVIAEKKQLNGNWLEDNARAISHHNKRRVIYALNYTTLDHSAPHYTAPN